MRGLITGVAVVLGVGIAITASSARAQTDAVTFTKDIAPILSGAVRVVTGQTPLRRCRC